MLNPTFDCMFWMLLFMIHDYLQKQPRKGILRNFTKFTWKHLCQSLFFNKVVGRNFIKKEALAQVFPCEFSKISKNTFFTEHLGATASGLVYQSI